MKSSMTINEMVNSIEDSSKRVISKDMLKAIILFYTSIDFNRFGYTRENNKRVKQYSMVFSRSGSSKSFSANLVQKLFCLETYPSHINIFYELMEKNTEPDEKKRTKKYLPQSVITSLSGTAEGLFQVAKAVSKCENGSLNLFSDEFIDTLGTSHNLISKLKEMYDSILYAKVIKGAEDHIVESHIENITANLLAMSSIDGMSKDSLRSLQSIAKSGLYRRSLIIHNEDYVETKKSIKTKTNIKSILSKQFDKRLSSLRERIDKVQQAGNMLVEYPSNVSADKIESIDKLLIDRANEDKLNVYKQYDIGSVDVIIDMAYLFAYIENKPVEDHHIDEAYSFFIDTRKEISSIFNEKEGHIELWNMLRLANKPLSHTEILAIDSFKVIPKAKLQFNETVALAREIALKNGYEILSRRGMTEKFILKKLDEVKSYTIIYSEKKKDMRLEDVSDDDILSFLKKGNKIKTYTDDLTDSLIISYIGEIKDGVKYFHCGEGKAIVPMKFKAEVNKTKIQNLLSIKITDFEFVLDHEPILFKGEVMEI